MLLVDRGTEIQYVLRRAGGTCAGSKECQIRTLSSGVLVS